MYCLEEESIVLKKSLLVEYQCVVVDSCVSLIVWGIPEEIVRTAEGSA